MEMKFKYMVKIYQESRTDTFEYSTIELAENVFEYAKKDNCTAQLYERDGLAWVLLKETHGWCTL